MEQKSIKDQEIGELFGECEVMSKLKVKADEENHGRPLVCEIERFVRKYKKSEDYDIDKDFLVKNFENPTNKIKYDTSYEVVFIPIKKTGVTLSDCLDYMKQKKLLFVGPSLLPLILKSRRSLRREVWLMSPDLEEKGFIRANETDPRFACVKLDDDGYVSLQLALYKAPVGTNFAIVALRKLGEQNED